MIVTQIHPRRRSCCSNLVLRRAPRPHDMKLRQHGLRSWPCWLPNAGKHSPVKTARKGTPHEKSSSPRESCFFRGLDWRGVSMLHRAAIPLVTHSAASCLASGDLLVLHLKIDIFCHLSIFFLTSANICCGAGSLDFVAAAWYSTCAVRRHRVTGRRSRARR